MENNALSFVQYSYEDVELSGGFMTPGTEEWFSIKKEFYDINDQEMYNYEYYAGLLKIISREPSFLDAYAHIGYQLLDDGEIDKAEEYFLKGLDIAQKLIPNDFSGRIPWSDLDNRPFLRLHHGYILCHIKKQKLKKAIQLIEQHLEWNPNDNIGVRFLLSETCHKVGITHFKYNNRKDDL